MRQNLVVILYFLSLAKLILPLGAWYLLSVGQLIRLNKEFNDHIWMSHPTYQSPIFWSIFLVDNSDEIYFNCFWAITSGNENITVNIIYIKWIFCYELWRQVKFHPRRNPNVSQRLDVVKPQSIFKSLAEAFLKFYDFPEPHLNKF